jgi:hypothetical protein
MANRSTYLFTGNHFSSALSTNRIVESHKEAVFIHMQYNDLGPFNPTRSYDANNIASNLFNNQRISPYGFSVSFPTSIWGFSLLHTPNKATSFGVLKSNIFIKQPLTDYENSFISLY